MALSALAGPLANAIMGLISAALLGFTTALYYYLMLSGASRFVLTCISYTTLLFELSALYNLLFMAFNLIPIPPFDGSRIALAFLPPKTYFGIMKYERQIMVGLLVVLLLLSRLGFSPFSWIAYNLTELVANPAFELFAKLFGVLA
jgi:Zn-dependent protease